MTGEGIIFYSFITVPTIVDICEAMEHCSKPVIVALFGSVFGGGCEVAVSAHYRVADKRTKYVKPHAFVANCSNVVHLNYQPNGHFTNFASP